MGKRRIVKGQLLALPTMQEVMKELYAIGTGVRTFQHRLPDGTLVDDPAAAATRVSALGKLGKIMLIQEARGGGNEPDKLAELIEALQIPQHIDPEK